MKLRVQLCRQVTLDITSEVFEILTGIEYTVYSMETSECSKMPLAFLSVPLRDPPGKPI